MAKIVVYSAITGGWDQPRQVMAANVPHIMFYDDPMYAKLAETAGWEPRLMTAAPQLDFKRRARFYKHHPLELLPDVDKSIWVDASLQIMAPLTPLAEYVDADALPLAAYSHPVRTNIAEEAREILRLKLDHPMHVQRQLDEYRAQGAPDTPLFSTSCLVRDHRHPLAVPIQNHWWDQILKYSIRDQMSLPYVLWSRQTGCNPLQPGKLWFGQQNPYLTWHHHTKGHTHNIATERNSLDDLYFKAWQTPGDINVHCPLLREISSKCRRVVEFGVWRAASTTALLAGQPEWMRSYDLVWSPEIPLLEKFRGRTDFAFEQADSRTIPPVETDLLFIDTLHTEAQLYAELTRHHAGVTTWIIMHDTFTFGQKDEDGGQGHGLLAARDRFLTEHPEWHITYHTDANNGLTILGRK